MTGRVHHPPCLQLMGEEIPWSQTVKYLGVTIDRVDIVGTSCAHKRYEGAYGEIESASPAVFQIVIASQARNLQDIYQFALDTCRVGLVQPDQQVNLIPKHNKQFNIL